jgi:NTP pyrophosphatase (non-canonical NTP hydrolase)
MSIAKNYQRMVCDAFYSFEQRKAPQENIDFNKQGIRLSSLGLPGEVGEVLELIKKQEFHSNIDYKHENMALELGDILWYLTLMAAAHNYSLEEIMTMNIEKLAKLYPDLYKMEDIWGVE